MLWELPVSIVAQLLHAHFYFEGLKVRRVKQLKTKELGELERLMGLS